MKKTKHAKDAVPSYPTWEEMNALVRAGLMAVAVGNLSACSSPANEEGVRTGGKVINTLPATGSSGRETEVRRENLPVELREQRTADRKKADSGPPRTCFPGVAVQQVNLEFW